MMMLARLRQREIQLNQLHLNPSGETHNVLLELGKMGLQNCVRVQ